MTNREKSSANSISGRLFLLATALLACVLMSQPAVALTTTLKVETVSAIDNTTMFPFEVLVDAHLDGEDVIYTITNKGADWPRYTLVGVFYAYGIGVVANQRIKLKTGETYVLRGKTFDHMPNLLEFRINADWINQDFVMRGSPSRKPSDVEQAARETGASLR